MNTDEILLNIKIDELDRHCQSDFLKCTLFFMLVRSIREFIENAKKKQYDKYLFQTFDVKVPACTFKKVMFIGTVTKVLLPEETYFVYYSKKKLKNSVFDHLIIIENEFNQF